MKTATHTLLTKQTRAHKATDREKRAEHARLQAAVVNSAMARHAQHGVCDREDFALDSACEALHRFETVDR